MLLHIASRRLSEASLVKQFGNALILDVTSKGAEPWVRFSPFYPHMDIPVPFSPGVAGASVEGIWQGLKVFEGADVDMATINNATMKGIKRTVRSNGPVRGHREGINGERLLPYLDARRLIYLPIYRFILEHRVVDLVDELRERAAEKVIVLLDYETNADLDDLSRPLSHASLIKAYIEDTWPG
jgi:hypothetical protein